jgi:hypothetical protein
MGMAENQIKWTTMIGNLWFTAAPVGDSGQRSKWFLRNHIELRLLPTA